MSISPFEPVVLEHFARHHGVASRTELIEFGLSRGQIERLVAAGALVVVHPGVYRVGSTPATFESSCLAACRASSDVVIGGPSAARLWGFKHTERTDPVFAIVPHDQTPIGRDVVLRRSNVVPAHDLVQRHDGIRLTAPPRTWFDRARDMSDERFEALTEYVLDRHCTVPTMWETARRLMVRGRPGAARVRRVLSQRAAWQKPADSRLEYEVLRALEGRGITLVRQYPLRLRNGVVIHLDGANPELRWGIEVDHITWHGGRADVARDKRRDRRARQLGWEVDRIDDQEWRDDRDGVLTDLIGLYTARGGQLRPAA